jgi:hypothetical protein
LSLRSPSHVCIRNTIPFPVSVVLTLKYYIGNITWKPRFFLFFIILPEYNNRYSISFSNTIAKTSKRNITPCTYYKKINNNILLRVISSIYSTPSIFIKTKPIIFVRSTEYLRFSNKNLSRKNNKNFIKKKKRFLRKSFN